jgi:hypothetical protein
MKKINTPTVQPHRALRRFIRKMFTSFIKHQTAELQHGFRKEVIQKLQNIEDMIGGKWHGRRSAVNSEARASVLIRHSKLLFEMSVYQCGRMESFLREVLSSSKSPMLMSLLFWRR